MEALAAIGLASGIVQFADCGVRWASSAKELYTSSNGMLQENSELENVTSSLRAVVLGLKTDKRLQGDKNLDALIAECLPLADELMDILNKLKVEVRQVEEKKAKERKAEARKAEEKKAKEGNSEARKAEEKDTSRLDSSKISREAVVEERNRSRLDSIRKALKSLWRREHIQDIERRLERIRDQIYAHVNFLLA
jgi:hypothetical protein